MFLFFQEVWNHEYKTYIHTVDTACSVKVRRKGLCRCKLFEWIMGWLFFICFTISKHLSWGGGGQLILATYWKTVEHGMNSGRECFGCCLWTSHISESSLISSFSDATLVPYSDLVIHIHIPHKKKCVTMTIDIRALLDPINTMILLLLLSNEKWFI